MVTFSWPPPLCLQIHHEIGRKNYLQHGGSQNTANGPAAQVRPGCLLRRHQPCVKPPGSGFLQRDFRIRKKSLTDAAAAGALTSEARILNILEFFGPLESPLQELATIDETSIWAGDGVHLTSNGGVGVSDPSEDHPSSGSKGCPVSAAADAKAGTNPAGCPASCRRTCAETLIREASSAEGGAATTRE
jgi:hypothetical protein